jgi:TfoX/Sxy family transcriptional regulator of competence genes
MPSDPSFIKFLTDQLESAGQIRSRKMFGEYALYCDDKVVALVCDNQLFVKVTDAGRAFIGDKLVEGYAYPGAKASFNVTDYCEERDWITELIKITHTNLPAAKAPKALTQIDKALPKS